jgi:SAM-dependent methyltransferase
MPESTCNAARAFEPGAIRWAEGNGSVHRRCTVCGHDGPHRPLLDVPAMSPPNPLLQLLGCSRCDSVFYDPPDIRDFSDIGQQGSEFWRFYLEVGGGVWETIWPLLALGTPPRTSLLDIGCGFGFALDFWRRRVADSAEGIELAEYGRMGAAMLGVTIHGDLLQHCAPVAGRRYGVVFASEVIEHVPDPRAFVALLAPFVADDGMLVMTTPCASFVRRENQSTTLLAALAPGFHGFLLSPDAFADTARRAGFAHVIVRRYNERMVLWASRAPLEREPDPDSVRPEYFDYMAERFALPDDSPPLWQGYAYRYLRDLVNTGRWPTAKIVAMELARSVIRSHGDAILDPAAIVPRLAAATFFAEAADVGPFFLPSLYYFLACVAHHVDRNPVRAARLYSGAAEAIVACARLGSLFYLEAASLLWHARRGAAQMQLAAGNVGDGVREFAAMADAAAEAGAANAYTPADPHFVEASLVAAVEGLIAREQGDHAQTLIDAYLRHVAREYGPAMTTADGIETALRDSHARLPRDPLFGLWVQAIGMRHGADAAARNGILRDVARIAESFGAEPQFGPRFRELGAKAQRLVAPPAKNVVFSFETTYKVTPTR